MRALPLPAPGSFIHGGVYKAHGGFLMKVLNSYIIFFILRHLH